MQTALARALKDDATTPEVDRILARHFFVSSENRPAGSATTHATKNAKVIALHTRR